MLLIAAFITDLSDEAAMTVAVSPALTRYSSPLSPSMNFSASSFAKSSFVFPLLFITEFILAVESITTTALALVTPFIALILGPMRAVISANMIAILRKSMIFFSNFSNFFMLKFSFSTLSHSKRDGIF